MQWQGEGTAMTLRRHGEHAVILTVLTRDMGLMSGVVPGGASTRRAANAISRPSARAALPDAALAWLADQGATVQRGKRVDVIGRGAAGGARWRVEGTDVDHVVLASASWDAVRLLRDSGPLSRTELARRHAMPPPAPQMQLKL